MKIVKLVLAISVSAMGVFAKEPSRELMQVTRALVSNPDIVQELNKNNASNLSEYKVTAMAQGVYKYELVFTRKCHCIPSTANVTIIEDMTPTYADGSPKYKTSIRIKSGF
jgi:hypothetical protein